MNKVEDGSAPPENNLTVEDGDGSTAEKFKVYPRRYAILFSFALTYFMAQWYGNRAIIIAESFAFYHNTTTNFSPETGDVGIDFIVIFGNLLSIPAYVVSAYAVDRIGLMAMVIGSIGIALNGWIWYLAGPNFNIVILARAVSTIFGTWNTSSILALSNRWFPDNERARATAFGTVFGLLGAGAAQVIGVFFYTDERVVELSLKSCRENRVSEADRETFQTYLDAGVRSCNSSIPTYDESFCCYQPANIEFYNLIQACIMTAVAIYAVIAVRNLPPTPPSYGAAPKVSKDIQRAPKLLLTNKRIMAMSFVDLLVTGPPSVLFSALSRVLPSSVRNLSFLMAAAGVGVSIPTAAFFSWYLDKKRYFFSMTAAGYIAGTSTWLLASIGFESGTLAGAYLIVICGALAVIAYLVWGVSEYELKLEWAFVSDMNIEGAVASIDRIVINISSMTWLALIPPERVTLSGTYWIGFAVLLVGTISFLFIPNKFEYYRMQYEAEHHSKFQRRSSLPLIPFKT